MLIVCLSAARIIVDSDLQTGGSGREQMHREKQGGVNIRFTEYIFFRGKFDKFTIAIINEEYSINWDDTSNFFIIPCCVRSLEKLQWWSTYISHPSTPRCWTHCPGDLRPGRSTGRARTWKCPGGRGSGWRWWCRGRNAIAYPGRR